METFSQSLEQHRIQVQYRNLKTDNKTIKWRLFKSKWQNFPRYFYVLMASTCASNKIFAERDWKCYLNSPLCKDGNVWFATVPLKPLNYFFVVLEDIVFFLGLILFQSVPIGFPAAEIHK